MKVLKKRFVKQGNLFSDALECDISLSRADLIWLTGVCLCPLIRFDWGGCSLLRTSQTLTWGHAPPQTGTGKPRRSQHFPARVKQLSSPGPAPGQSSTILRRKFPFLSPGCSESRVWALVTVTDCRGTEYLLTRDWSMEHWGQECAILWYSVVTKRIQAVHYYCTHTWWKYKTSLLISCFQKTPAHHPRAVC